jgi:hypothetical protein
VYDAMNGAIYQSLVPLGDWLCPELVQHLVDELTVREPTGEVRIGPKLGLELATLAFREMSRFVSRQAFKRVE